MQLTPSWRSGLIPCISNSSCGDAQDNEIDKKDGIDTSSFYIQMGTAQFGAWASWATCVGLLVFSTIKLWRYHQEENMRVSMAIARERHIKGTSGGGARSREEPEGAPSTSDSANLLDSSPNGTGAKKKNGASGKRPGGTDPAIHSI